MIYHVEAEFFLSTPQNLKEKRAILQRILSRTKQKFNASIAETGFQDKWQRTEISFVIVSGTSTQSEKEAYQVLDFLDSFPEWERTNTHMEHI